MSSSRPADPSPRGRLPGPAAGATGRPTLLPTTLTGRLVLTSIALVAAVSIVVAVVTTLALRSFLLQRLDAQLSEAVGRVEVTFPGGPDLSEQQLCMSGDRGPGGQIPAQGPGSLNGVLVGQCPHAEVVTEDGPRKAVSDASVAILENVPVDAAPHTVDLPGLGTYR